MYISKTLTQKLKDTLFVNSNSDEKNKCNGVTK